MATATRTWQLPAVDVSNEGFLKAANEGRLVSRFCSGCQQWHWYPRPICPYCQADTEWRETSGQGEIYSVTVNRRGGPAPYALAYVKLEEGITLLTQIIADDLDSLQIGQAVQVTFQEADEGQRWPLFRPV